MQLTHIAIWTNELERSRDFYIKYFNGKSNEKYVNPKKGFASYFVTFEGGASLEIMQRTDITKETADVFIGLVKKRTKTSGTDTNEVHKTKL